MSEGQIAVLGAMAGMLGVLVGTMLKARWDRGIAKRQPKTVGRAQAYEAFLAHFLTHATPQAPTEADRELTHVVSRLIVYGESEPLCAAADFMLKYRALDSPGACAELQKVVAAMRRSLKTSSNQEVMGWIGRLIRVAAGVGEGRGAAAAD